MDNGYYVVEPKGHPDAKMIIHVCSTGYGKDKIQWVSPNSHTEDRLLETFMRDYKFIGCIHLYSMLIEPMLNELSCKDMTRFPNKVVHIGLR